MLGDVIMFFWMTIMMYFIVQIHHYKNRYGVVYDMVNGGVGCWDSFFIKDILKLFEGAKVSKNTLVIIGCVFVAVIVQYPNILWLFLLFFIVSVLWRMHYERKYLFVACIFAGLSVVFGWGYSMMFTQIHTPAGLYNLLLVIIPTYYILMHAKGKLCSQKYTILWLLMLLIN